MTVSDVLDVASSSVTVRCGSNYIENVSTDNPLVSQVIFNKTVKGIEASLDQYDNGILEVKIEE